MIEFCQNNQLSIFGIELLPEADVVGSVADYVCWKGYEHFGPTELECTESGWMDRNRRADLPVCILIDCGALPALENGEMHADDQTYGAKVLVKCLDGFKRIGPIPECTANKTWGDVVPRCEPIACSHPPDILNGIAMENVYAADELAQYGCMEGFQLSSPSALTCSPDGSWLGQVAQCLPAECNAPEEIEFGSWEYSAGSVEKDAIFYTGAEIVYFCHGGYHLEGEGRRRCLGSVGWMPSLPLPTCRKKVCPSLENPEYGTVKTNFQSKSNPF